MGNYTEGTDYSSVSAPATPAASSYEEPTASGKGPKLKPAEAKALKERLKCSERYMKLAFAPAYERCLKLWKGEHWAKRRTPSEQHRVVVNYILPNIVTKVASYAFAYPDFIVRPETQASAGSADIAKAALAYEWRKANVQREARRAAQDKELFNVGVVMTGWRFETDEVCLTDERQPVEGEPVDHAAVLAAVEAGQALPQPTPADKVRKDEIYCKRLNPKSFRIDPEADWVLDDARYCGYVEIVRLEDVKQDKRYKNTRDLKGTTKNTEAFLDDAQQDLDDAERSSDLKRVCLWHYFEKRRRLHVVFCDEHDNPLLVEEWHWEFDRYPFRLLFGPLLQDEFYGTPMPLLLEPMQREINETRSQLHTHRNRFNRKFQVARGTLDAQAKKQLRSGEDGTVVEHNGALGSSPIVPIQDAQLQPEVYQSDRIAQQDMAKVSGLDAYESGLIPSKRLTSGEVGAIQTSGAARMKQDAQQFEEFCAGIAQDCLDWLKQYAVKTRSLPIYDADQNVAEWQDYSREQIQGDFDIQVFVGSTQIKNSEDEIKDIGFLFQTLTPFIQAGLVNPKPLIEQMLKRFTWLRNVQDIVNPPPPPLPPGGPGGPPGMPGPDQGGGPPGAPGPGGGGPPGGLPPELMAQMGMG